MTTTDQPSPNTSPLLRREQGILATVFKTVSLNWLGFFVNMGLAFVIAPLTVNALGTVYYGIWTLVMQFTGYLWLFDFGVRESVVKYVAQHHAADEKQEVLTIVSTALAVYGGVATVTILCVALLTIALPYAFNIPVEAVWTARLATLLTGLTIAQSFVCNVFVGILLGIQKYYLTSAPSLAFSLIRTGIIYLLLTNGGGLVALATLQFVMGTLMSFVIYWLCRRELPYLSVTLTRPRRDEVTKLFNYGKYVLINNLGDKIVFSTDSIVIAAFLPVSSLTHYAIGGSLIEYFRNFIGSMSSIVNPIASSLEARKDVVLLSRLLIAASKGSVLIGLPVCVGFIILGERFIALWMGPALAPESGRVLAVLAVGYLIGLPYRTISAVLYGLGKHQNLAYSRIVEGLVNLAISVALVSQVGVVGVAIGTAIPHALIVAGYLPLLLPRLMPLDLRDYFVWSYVRPLIAVVPFAGLCWVIEHYLAPANLIVFMASVIAALTSYAVPAWFFVLDKNERARAARVLRARSFSPVPGTTA